MTRNFSDVIADWMEGRRPKPGTICVAEDVPEYLIIQVWGSVPSAVALEGTTFTFKETRPGFYRVTVRFT